MIDSPDTTAIERKATDVCGLVETYEVTNQETADEAGNLIQSVAALLDKVEEAFNPHVARAHELHKGLLAEKKKHAEPLLRARSLLNDRLSKWMRAEKLKAEEEERRLRAEQRKIEEERLLNEALDVEADGDAAAVSAVLERPIQTAPAYLPSRPKVSGISARQKWKARIVKPEALPREYLIPDESKISRVVAALGRDANISGVEVYEDTEIARKARV